MLRQRQEGSVGKLDIAGDNLHVILLAAPAFDHELRADRKAAGKTTGTVRHDNLRANDRGKV
jgi:hypothetical protein